jgi:heptosyltransferase-2
MTDLTSKNIKKILVIRKHNQIGDILVSVPMYYALKKYFPQAQITLLASKTNYPIPFKELNPYLDEVIIFDKSSLKRQLEIIKFLRNENFDLAIVPSTIRLSSTSNLLSFLSGIKYRVGVSKVDDQKNKFSFLLNIKKEFHWGKNKTHQVFRNLEVIEQINCKINVSEALNSFIKITDNEKIEAKEILKTKLSNPSILIGLHPGGGKIENIWNWKNFFEVAKQLREKWNCSFLITAGSIDKEIVENIGKNFTSINYPFFIAENFPVRKLAALINECDLFISNDTGVMHIAGLTKTYLISLFKKNKSYEWAPLSRNKFFIESEDENINSISVDQVLSLSEKLLRLKSFRKD